MKTHTLPLATLLTAPCQTVPEWTAWYRKHGIEPGKVVRVRRDGEVEVYECDSEPCSMPLPVATIAPGMAIA